LKSDARRKCARVFSPLKNPAIKQPEAWGKRIARRTKTIPGQNLDGN